MPEATLTTGAIRGRRIDGVRRFLGIPYALPPFGERRFAPPVPVPPWSGVRDASRFGETAPQTPYPGALGALLGTVAIPGDDVLTVNVWAPEHVSGAPVMLWVHGGSLERGSSAIGGYDGTPFAVGAPANLTLYDAAASRTFSVTDLHGKSVNSPYLGLTLPGHLVQCFLQTVEVVGVQKRKIKFLSMDQHLSVLLSLSPRRRCYSRTQPGCRCP